MTKKLKTVVFLLGTAPLMAFAQTVTEGNPETDTSIKQDNAAFVFTESQLGENDDVTQNVIMVNSSSNVYTSNVGYLFSPARYKYRAYNSRYNDIYFNGVQVNNAENGQFNYSTIGGMNDATRSIDASGVFESNAFSMASLGGSSNYNFRASNYAAGHKFTLSGANRNYTLRAMYDFGTGVTKHGWAFFGTVGYRWANMETAAVEGTFYNSLSYFLSLQKIFNPRHALNLATWGNPTERAQQGASTDEAYWLANDYQYNPYWGYQGGKKRTSRVVHNYEPTAMLTWDFNITDRMKLTTSLIGKYAMYSSTKLNYNDAQNPAPDYWKNFPSAYYDVWDIENSRNWEYATQSWQDSYNYWRGSKYNRQIHWDELYVKNQGLNADGKDAAYFIQAKHNNHIATNFGSTFDWSIDKQSKLQVGLQLSNNIGQHYQTIDDLMGAEYMHNVNNYAIGTYMPTDPKVQYDLRSYAPNNPESNRLYKGDRYGFDYNLINQKAGLWATYTKDKGISHSFISGRVDGQQMWRDGKMQNGMCADYSYGKSGKARFLDGGFKMGTNLNLGKGNAISFGTGYETRAPLVNVAFVSPEMNNNYVSDLKNEKVISSEFGYMLNNKWVQLNLTAYYTHTYNGTEWQNFYNDDENSFTYNSLTGVEKDYYGVELGVKVKVTSNLTINMLGSWAEAKYISDTKVTYMRSTDGIMREDLCLNKGIRESGTPLAAASLGLKYSIKGWYFNLNGNYYDRIYLGYSSNMRYTANLKTADLINSDGTYNVPAQAKGKGGFMLDGSIGHTFRIARHPLNVNLMVTNITNNRKLCTGGYEQSRSNYSTNKNGEKGSERLYDFVKNPKKFYAQGINFMLNMNYRF